MATFDDSNCVAVFDRHEDAEAAVRELVRVGINPKKLSIVGRDYHGEDQATGFYAGDPVRYWGRAGAFWGSVFGILLAAVFWIPGIGPILTGGLVGSALMGTLEGAAVGAAVGGGVTALGAALASMGLPQDKLIGFETALKAGRYVLMANGTGAQVESARATLAGIGTEADVHHR